MSKTDIIQHYGIQNRVKQRHNNRFEEFTYDDLRKPSIYNPHQEFAYWQGIKQNHNYAEYFKSTQNEHGYRCETQDELEHRVISPGYANFYNEITPERLAHDPNDTIYNYYAGWHKNISDGGTSINALRSQLRTERRANYPKIVNQVTRFIYNTHSGVNGPIYHPEA